MCLKITFSLIFWCKKYRFSTTLKTYDKTIFSLLFWLRNNHLFLYTEKIEIDGIFARRKDGKYDLLCLVFDYIQLHSSYFYRIWASVCHDSLITSSVMSPTWIFSHFLVYLYQQTYINSTLHARMHELP